MIVETVKLVGQLAVGIGVGAVTKTFIQSITPENVAKFTKVAIVVGGWFIGGVLTIQASKKWNSDVDSIVTFAKKIKNIKNQKVEEKTETEAE